MSNDFYEIDFLGVGDNGKSGDAIAIRYQINGQVSIHIIDAGYNEDGEKLAKLILDHYNTSVIDHLVLTHPHADHIGGAYYLLEHLVIKNLWVHMPWTYADSFINNKIFRGWTNADNLEKELRKKYASVVELVELAKKRGIPIREPFKGTYIGEFEVLSPSKSFFIEQFLKSDRSPQVKRGILDSLFVSDSAQSGKVTKSVEWGVENFSDENTDPINETSVIQMANLSGQTIMLTGDAGRVALNEAIEYAKPRFKKGSLLGAQFNIDIFQVPHHGARRNLSSEILDKIFRKKFSSKKEFERLFTAIISASKDDPEHPKKAVVRGLIHRGAEVLVTNGRNLVTSSCNAPARVGYSPAYSANYPTDQEY